MCLFGLCVCGDVLLLLFRRPVQNLDYKGFCDQYLFKEKKKNRDEIQASLWCAAKPDFHCNFLLDKVIYN